MDPKISKSQIQTEYQARIDEGLEDWEARASVISSFLYNSPLEEPHSQPGTADYYFTIQTIWNLCGK
jgi:hypothetical protein